MPVQYFTFKVAGKEKGVSVKNPVIEIAYIVVF